MLRQYSCSEHLAHAAIYKLLVPFQVKYWSSHTSLFSSLLFADRCSCVLQSSLDSLSEYCSLIDLDATRSSPIDAARLDHIGQSYTNLHRHVQYGGRCCRQLFSSSLGQDDYI